MGLKSLKEMNLALLGKWLWRIGDDSHGLWKQVVFSKYDLFSKYDTSRDGWFIRDAIPRDSGLWKGFLAVKELFLRQVRFRVAREIKFVSGWTFGWGMPH